MNSNILNLRHLTVLFILCTAFLGGAIPAFAQQGGKKMTGQVIDENKEPMIGVSILIVGTSTGTVTDFDGNYTLNVPKDSKELQFSYVGYETKVIAIPANGNVLNVQMKSDSQVLSDVVVIGYGTQRKSDLTGSVTNVSSKDFNMGLVSSPEQLINGKISGVQIMSNSGSPTSGSTIRVRGGASLNASNDPLIVLDGVPLEQGGISGNDGNFLSLINPNDIESMTILKDGKERTYYVYNNCSHQEAYKETGMQGVSYTTGVPAMIGAMMFLKGLWKKPGVWNVEEFNPDPFMEQLNKQGLPWHEVFDKDLEV